MKVSARSHADVVLRPYTMLDRKAWNEAVSADLEKRRRPQSHEEFKKRLRRFRRGVRKDVLYVLGIFHRDGRHLGEIDFYILTRLDLQLAHIGYGLHSQHQGQGFATTAVRLGLRVAFEDLQLQRVEAYIRPDNERSIQLAERAGMRCGGLRPKSSWCDGAWHDHIAYEATAGEDLRAPAQRPTLDHYLR